jgi:hypothetical protein
MANPYENPYDQQNPYQQPQQQPSWTGAAAGTTTSTGGPQTGSLYNQYQPQQNQQPRNAPSPQSSPNWGWPQQQPQQQSWYGQAPSGSAPQGQYPFQYNYAPQPPAQGGGARPPQDGGYRPSGDQQGDAIARAYQQYLGRNPSADEVRGWMGNRTAIAEIAGSAEARSRGGGGAAQVDPRSWNTDGYTPPQYIAQAPAGHPPPGWNRQKWADPNHQTPKYVIGRILSQFSPRTSNMDAVVAEIAKAYPGARRSGSGDITIPGIGSTDILKAADVGGKAWQFGGQSKSPKKGGDQYGAPAGGGYGGAPGGVDPYTQLLQTLAQPAMQAPQAAAPAQSWEQSPQYQQMAAQMAQLQQQMATWQQQAAAQQQQAAARGPQFSYY